MSLPTATKQQSRSRLMVAAGKMLAALRGCFPVLRTRKTRIDLPQFQHAPALRKGSLAVVAIIWNEARDLREWIEFQRTVGVSHVYLYDDGSTDHTLEIVAPYVRSAYVTCIPWSSFIHGVGPQRLAYAHALATFGCEWDWMTFIDLDEFLFPVVADTLPAALQAYEDLPAVVVPWHMYGHGGHDARPAGRVIESYLKRTPFPPPASPTGLLNWKSIVRPTRVIGVDSPHLFVLDDGRRGGYSETRQWIDTQRPEGWENLESRVFRLNHYFTKSREDFLSRRSLGRSVTGRDAGKHVNRARYYAQAIEAAPALHDTLILRFLPQLRAQLDESPEVCE